MSKPVPQRPLFTDVPAQPGDIVFSLDSHGRFIHWNDVATEVFGYSWPDVQGVPLDTLFPLHGSGPDRARLDLDLVMAGTDFSGGFSCRRRDGVRIEIYLFASAGRDETGGTAGVICIGREVTTFWQAGRAMRAAEQKFQVLFNLSPDVIALIDARGRFVEVNEAGARMTGHSVAELAELTALDLVPAERRTAAEAEFSRIRRRPQIQGVVAIRPRGGGRIEFEYRASLLRLEGKNLVLVVGRDATERLRAVGRLRESEERFRAIFESARDALFLETLDGRIVEANPAAAAMLGYHRDELLKLTTADLLPAESRAWLPQIVQALLRDREFQAEGVNLHRSGAEVPVELSGSLVERAAGADPLVLVAVRDITDRRAAEQRLRESEESFRALAENANDGILIVTGPGRHAFANRRAADIMGRSVTELLGTSIADLAAPDELPALMSRYEHRMRGEPVPSQYESVIVRFDGRRVPVELTAAATVWRGEPADMVVVRDVSERKRVEQELREMAETAMELVRMAPDANLLKFAARSLTRLVPGAAVATGATRVESVAGFPAGAEELLAARLGRPLIGLEFERNDPAVIESLVSGRLVEIPGGLCGVLLGRVSEEDCRAVEDRLGTGGAFVVGLRRGERVLGSVFILPPRGTRPDARVVETFASQVSVALDRQQAERAVRESERRLATLMANLPGMAYRCANNPDRTMEFASEGSFALTGYQAGELTGNRAVSFGKLIRPDDREAVRQGVRSALDGRRPYELEYRIADRAGAVRWVWEQGRGVFDESGALVALEGFIADVSERRRAEEELAASREEFSSLFNRSPVGIYRTTPDGRILMANPALVRMLGYRSFEELAARRLGETDFQPGYDREEFRRRLEADGEITGLETLWTRADGGKVYVRENARLVLDAGGRPAYFEGTVEDLTERRRIEDEVWRAKEHLRTLQDNVPVGLFRTLPDGRFLMVNRAAVRMFGYGSEDEVRAAGVGVMYADPDERKRMIERLLTEGRLDNAEMRARRKNGEEFEALLNVTANLDEEGRPCWFDGAIQDISARKRAEAERQEVERRYRQVVERANDGICVIQDGQLVFVNERLARMARSTPEELTGQPFEQHLHPDSRAAVAERYRRRMAGEPVPETYEAALLTTGGVRIDAELNAGVIEYEGRPADLVFVRDISERRQRQAELAASEERYRQLVERAPDGIAVHQDGIIKLVNPAVLRILGYDRAEELVGRPVLDFVHPDDRAQVAERMRGALERGEPAGLLEERFVRRDGSPVWVEASASTFTWEGRPAVRVFARDVSQLAQARRQARQMTELLGTVLDFSPHGFAVVQGREVVMANRAWARLLGYDDPAGLVGEDYLERVPPGDRARAEEGADSPLLAGGRTVTETIRLRGRDGGIVAIPTLIRVAPWRGRPALFLMSRTPGL